MVAGLLQCGSLSLSSTRPGEAVTLLRRANPRHFAPLCSLVLEHRTRKAETTTPPSPACVRLTLFPAKNSGVDTHSQYINQTSPYKSLNTYHFWKGYPHIALPALTKWYCQSSWSLSFLPAFVV